MKQGHEGKPVTCPGGTCNNVFVLSPVNFESPEIKETQNPCITAKHYDIYTLWKPGKKKKKVF